MATLTVQEVRDVAHWTVGDIEDVKVEGKIDDAVNYINLVTGLSIVYAGSGNLTCTSAQKPIIRMLSALYSLAYVTGGSSFGLNVNVGELRSEVLTQFPALDAILETIKKGTRLLTLSAGVPFKSVNEPIT